MTNHEIWQAVLAEFELSLSKANFTTWFKSTGVAKYDGGHVVVCVPNAFTKSWLEKKYHSKIVQILERVTGKPIRKIEYTVDNVKNIEEQECATTEEPQISSVSTPLYSPQRKNSLVQQFGLNSKYVFDSFIVGKGNELAHAAAQAVAERPGDAYNPLFIYGGVGLGKTHLIQAIGQTMLEANPQTKILYVSSEKFTNEFVSSVKEGRAKEFKDRYRNVDLLLIDDIQFIGGKEQTQEEFFHTFNELHQQGKQVVMTSDRPPKAIPALEDRLRSRFEWGMIADIGAPDLETRMAILEQKAQEKNFAIEKEFIQLIATTIQSNIRELEGALNKMIAFHELKNVKPTRESIKQLLVSFEEQSMRRSLTPREMIQEVARYFDIQIDDVLGKSREKRLAFPRQIIMYLMREELKLSYPSIGDELGGRDHTTAMHAHTKISTGLEDDLKLKQDIELIKQRLYANSV
ncbi:chromosomal replication initiator protein DnaA [Candidatus Parcubacteria bacterium]|jgi:chromosomal replication initiator protein|nr:chromosomal replication initiator protein DnaA [Candidatus Parcubacteria bacterium]MBT3948987.1 chromosomal replication initiator protein DnaA [Candidatus Parcubacteria bacterium]